MSTASPAQHGVASLADYAGPGQAFDEMKTPGGDLRPHWTSFAHSLDSLSADEFTERWHDAQQLIHENGVTYNVYGDPRGLNRPWQFDPVPLILSAREGALLAAGLAQRARLLEAILTDIYGPQQLCRRRLLPPEVLFANPGFLRPCHGLQLVGARHLYLAAFDVGRGPDGTMRVLSHRSQAPSGAGYALENRIVLARMLPEVFRDCRVQRLASFFRRLRDTLRSNAPQNQAHPRVVLLTPGPFNETYFEHAYLARYLGFTLAEGGDLTVRDHRVYLKILDGLQPVDVIWRRLDDDYCDPLELRGDSFLGIPGLVQAVRAGNVVVANSLGSGFAEAPALLPYLPVLCRQLLGESLTIPSAATYWCGDAAARQHVLSQLAHMVIKPAFRSLRFEPIFPERLTQPQRAELIAKINAQPHAFVGQERVELSTTPVLTAQGMAPRRTVLRCYLSAHQDGFELMPGGLTRVTRNIDSTLVSVQRGGGSKDTWLLTDGPVDQFSLLQRSEQVIRVSRADNDLPSRVADNLFWLGRYVERAGDLVRLLRGIVVRLTEKSGLAEAHELPLLLQALTHVTQTLPGFVGPEGEGRLAAPEEEIYALVFSLDKTNSLAWNIRSIHRAASSVRDRISMDMWRTLSHLPPEEPGDPIDPPTLSELLDLLNLHVITLAGFGGIAMESMTRGHGWRFLELGRKLERALHTVRLLRSTLGAQQAHEGALLEAILEIADCSLTFRRRYLVGVQVAPVLDLLLADASNPRSLIFHLLALREVIAHLPWDKRGGECSPEQQFVERLIALVQTADVEYLALVDDQQQRPHLQTFLGSLHAELPLLADSIVHHYLSHLQPSRQLASSEALS